MALWIPAPIGVDGATLQQVNNVRSIKDGGVIAVKLADGSVATIKLADLAVTTAKLAPAAVTTAKLADGSVTSAKMAPTALPTPRAIEGSSSVVSTTIPLLTLEPSAGRSHLVPLSGDFVASGTNNQNIRVLLTYSDATTAQVTLADPLTRNWAPLSSDGSTPFQVADLEGKLIVKIEVFFDADTSGAGSVTAKLYALEL